MKGRNYRVGTSMSYVRREYIHGSPASKITKFTMGNAGGDFKFKVMLIPLKRVQIRDNAIEASRIAVNKVLVDKLEENRYCLRVRVYPHIILRENKMMAFAGADRLQEGMSRSFGKPIGLAARVDPPQPIMEVDVNEEGVEVAKQALRQGESKLPTPCIIDVVPAKKQ